MGNGPGRRAVQAAPVRTCVHVASKTTSSPATRVRTVRDSSLPAHPCGATPADSGPAAGPAGRSLQFAAESRGRSTEKPARRWSSQRRAEVGPPRVSVFYQRFQRDENAGSIVRALALANPPLLCPRTGPPVVSCRSLRQSLRGGKVPVQPRLVSGSAPVSLPTPSSRLTRTATHLRGTSC